MLRRLCSLIAAGALSGCPAPEAPPPAAPPPPPPPAAPASRPATATVHGLRNTSGIRYLDEGCDGKVPCRCAGAVKYGQNALAQIRVTEPRLAEGVFCVFGDFDGNGQADVAILDADWTPDGGAPGEVRVLLFDDLGLRAAVPLPKKMTSLGRVEVDGQQVLVEPAAARKYHFAFRADHFELVAR